MDLALFDFDGTITERETMPDFMLAAVRPGRLAVGKLVLLPLAWHKARGDRIVVVSGGLDLYLRHWAQAHGLELLCSSLEQKGGRFTGRYRGAQCVRAEKARRVQAAYPPERFGKVFAYGDTPEDHDLLAMAHEAYYRWQPLVPAAQGGR